MRYLMRDGAPLTDGQWGQIDQAVVEEASRTLTGRRFLDVKIMGAQVQTVHLDHIAAGTRAEAGFWGKGEADPTGVDGRRFVELPTIFADFSISWRDIENEQGAGVQAARSAALLAARREDDIIFHGDARLGIDGIFTAKGVNSLPISDWSAGEAPVADVAKALEVLVDQGNAGDKALVVSTDLFAKLHRIQAGTGMMEVDRIRSLVGKVFHSARLEKNTACLVYCDPQNIDLVVGQDLITAYMGNEQLDHVFRVMETMAPRIKQPKAIAILR